MNSVRITGKQAVIFDMDGVLVDSEPLHTSSFERVVAEIGHADHGIYLPDYFGRSDRVLWSDFLSRHRSAHTAEALTARREEIFMDALRKEVPIFPGLRQLLHDLQPAYKLALASGSSRDMVDGVIFGAQLETFFPVRISNDEVKHCKPDPECFLKAAHALHVMPDHCVVVEDSAAGVEAAHRAGMLAIAITNSLPKNKLNHADFVVKDYDEILRLLQ